MKSVTVIFVLLILLLFGKSTYSYAQKNIHTPIPKLVELSRLVPDSMQVLSGPPETVTMRSGYMVLPPNKSVGRHSTKNNEEEIVVLAGEGEFKIVNGKSFHVRPYCVVYCPPNTEHDVTNAGIDTLRYVYIVARTKN